MTGYSNKTGWIAVAFAVVTAGILALVRLDAWVGEPASLLEVATEDTASHAAAAIIDTRIHDVNGRLHRLGAQPSYGPVALVFLDTECPISRRYIPDLNKIAGQARQGGVTLYGIISDPAVSADAARAFEREYEIGFPILWDASGSLAELLDPKVVPEAYVVNADDRVVYRGRIDNRFESPGRLRGTISENDLADAIAAAAAGRPPQVATTQPVGCFFEAWKSYDAAQVTYERDVAPLLAANCTECHSAGGIGPFALDSYQSAKRRARMMAWAASERIMPPWKAEAGFGHFRSQRILSGRDIEVLQAWARSDQLRGDAKDKVPLKRSASVEWRLGKPDLEIRMPGTFDVPASGDDIYRYFVVPGGLASGAMIRGIDFRPGDPSVVHHAIFYVDYGGTARRLDGKDPQLGFSAFGGDGLMGAEDAMPIGGWAPGADPYLLPEGLGLEIPPGADFVFEIHYHLTGRATQDRSSAALYFRTKDEVDRTVEGLYLATENIDIPAGASDYVRRLSMKVPADIDLVDISPHMHYLGRTARVVAKLPDGRERPLINIPDWDFRWQNIYVYRHPVRLPAGSRIEAWYSYDNSAANAANPSSPPRNVKYGLQSSDEMCELYLTYVPVDPKDAPKVRRAMLASLMSPGPSAPAEERADPWDALKKDGLWEPSTEALLYGLDEKQFTSLLERAERYAGGESKNADAHALYGGLLLAALILEPDEQMQIEMAFAADQALGRALKIDSSHWDARITRGVLYLISEERPYVQAAVRILKSLLEDQAARKPRNRFAATYLYLGDAYAALERHEEAAKLWRLGLERFPDHAELKSKLEKALGR